MPQGCELMAPGGLVGTVCVARGRMDSILRRPSVLRPELLRLAKQGKEGRAISARPTTCCG